MGRVSLDDLDKYNNGGGGTGLKAKFLSLKNDGDIAQVHILLNDYEDLNDYCFNIHKVIVGKAKFPNRSVNCLRKYDDPMDKCPFCASGKNNSNVKVFIPIYNMDEDEVQFFERPKNYIKTLQKLMTRYSDNFPGHIFEIERNGEAGDTSTTYSFIEIDEDDTFDYESYIDEIPDLIGTGIMDASASDMEYYLKHDEFPQRSKKDDDEDEEPVRRRRSNRDDDEDDEEPPFEEDEKPRRRESGRRVSAKEDDRDTRRNRRRHNEDDF